MRALTVHQPWAQLIAVGAKTIETRSWPPPDALIGEVLVIHAAATLAGINQIAAGIGDPCGDIEATLAAHGYTLDDQLGLGPPYSQVPLGEIVASCRVVGAIPTDFVPPAQRIYGDFTPGRWAWHLDWIAPTERLCPACSGEGVFHDGALPQSARDCTIECEREVRCVVCDRIKPPIGRSVAPEMANSRCGWDCKGYRADPTPGDLWRGELAQLRERDCPVCDGDGVCDPIPARGAQRVWQWEPDA